MKHERGPAGCTAEVQFAKPLDIPASVEGFRRSGDDLLDRWDGEVLLRTVRVAGESFGVAAWPIGDPQTPRLRIEVAEPRHLQAASDAAARWFVTVPPATLAALTRRDPVIRAAEALHPGVRPVLQPDLLHALVRSISAQQINLRFAAVVRARLAERYGTPHTVASRTVYSLDPERLAAARAADLRALQFTTPKSEYIIGVASAVLGGSLDMQALEQRSDEEFVAELLALDGVGRWTAEWLLARSLGRPTVVAGDLGVRKAVGFAYFDGAMPTEQQVRERTAHWGQAAGVAQQLLLHVLAENRWEELSAAAAAP